MRQSKTTKPGAILVMLA